MAKRGYPRAQLSPIIMDDESVSYTWCWDIDAFFLDHQETPQEAWDAAHEALLEVDALRPRMIQAAPSLAWMLSRDN